MLSRAECAQLLDNGALSHSDADISGIGVILAFILSAYITFAAVLAAYVCGLVEDDLLNDVDRRIFRISPYRWNHPSVFVSLRKGVMALGDQQVVTGIAIISAGFQGLRTGSISVYHYQIVLYLAWMSSSVHLSALTVLGTFLTENKGLLMWRLFGMTVLLVLLLVALVPTTSNLWAGAGLNYPWSSWDKRGWGIPAKCFWDFRWVATVNPDAPLGYLILILSYIWKVGGLFKSTRTGYNRYFRNPIENGLLNSFRFAVRRYRARRSFLWLWIFRLLVALLLPIFTILEVLASFSASLWMSALGLAFGTIQVVIPRQQNQQFTASGESGWGFGQLVPLILLVQPVGAIMEHAWPGKEEREEIWAKYGPTSPRRESRSLAMSGRVELVPNSLMQCLGEPHGTNTAARAEEMTYVKELFFRSRYFALLVWLIQAAIGTTAGFVFYGDALSIGNDTAGNWRIALIVIGTSVGALIVTGILFSPFSRLYRAERRSSQQRVSDVNDTYAGDMRGENLIMNKTDRHDTTSSAEIDMDAVTLNPSAR